MRRPETRHRRANARSPQGGDPGHPGVAPDRIHDREPANGGMNPVFVIADLDALRGDS